MSEAVKIFLEAGKGDTSEAVFVKTFLKYLGKSIADEDFVFVGGWKKLEEVFSPQSRKPEIEKILIVFDADSSDKDGKTGGFAARKAELDRIVDGNAKTKIFLFPNNCDDGDFETLLERIANKEENERFFDCFSDFEKCLGDAYEHPNLKAKMFSYINLQKKLSCSQRKKLGRGQWLFDDKKYWDLDSSALEPLKEFFAENL